MDSTALTRLAPSRVHFSTTLLHNQPADDLVPLFEQKINDKIRFYFVSPPSLKISKHGILLLWIVNCSVSHGGFAASLIDQQQG